MSACGEVLPGGMQSEKCIQVKGHTNPHITRTGETWPSKAGASRPALEVRVRERCGECNGTGVGYHPAWDRYFCEEGAEVRKQADELRGQGKYERAADLEMEWFSQRGLMERTSGSVSVDIYPPEEIPCGECEDGWVERWAPLQEIYFAIADNQFARPVNEGKAEETVRIKVERILRGLVS